MNRIPEEVIKGEDLLAGVMVTDSKIRLQATEFLRLKGYQVINLMGAPIKGQISVPLTYSLNQKMGIFSRLKMMVTDRFHGSIFTLKLSDAPVIFIETESKYPIPNSKSRDLFNRLNIEFMVLKVGTNGIYNNLLEEKLFAWNENNPDVKKRLALLRREAQDNLILLKRAIH